MYANKLVGYEFTMREGDGLQRCSYFIVCITLLNNENKIKNNRITTFYNYCSNRVLILY